MRNASGTKGTVKRARARLTGRVAGFLCAGLVLLGSGLSAGFALAQGADGIHLDATYLAQPTDWCPANAGVPMLVTMDGPDIIMGPGERPRTVTVRRGGDVTLTTTAENTASFNRAEDVDAAYVEVIGRFSSEFRVCLSAFNASLGAGTWSLTATDGVIAKTGSFENESLGLLFGAPFFAPVAGPVPTYYAKVGEQLLFTAGRPEAKINQKFLTKPDTGKARQGAKP